MNSKKLYTSLTLVSVFIGLITFFTVKSVGGVTLEGFKWSLILGALLYPLCFLLSQTEEIIDTGEQVSNSKKVLIIKFLSLINLALASTALFFVGESRINYQPSVSSIDWGITPVLLNFVIIILLFVIISSVRYFFIANKISSIRQNNVLYLEILFLILFIIAFIK